MFYALLLRLLQVFFLATPLMSMLWRGVAFKSFNIVRGFIRMLKYFLMATFADNGKQQATKKAKGGAKVGKEETENEDVVKIPPLSRKIPKRLVPLFKALDYIDSCCIHARGLMQVLAGPVRLSPLHKGPTNTFIHFIETEYHMVFALMYFITTYMSEKALLANHKLLSPIMKLFSYSDLAKNAAWAYFFFMQYCAAMALAYRKDTWEVEEEKERVAALQVLLMKSACGVVVACLDMYCGFFASHTAHPLTLSAVQIVSAVYYIAITFI